MRQEISNWWRQAKKDLEVAEKNYEFKEYYACAFFSQQAVEKSLKALILTQTKQKVEGHSLVYLGKTAKVPENYLSNLKKLSPQYFLARYPDASEDVPFDLYDQKITLEFLETAREVLKWIEKQLE